MKNFLLCRLAQAYETVGREWMDDMYRNRVIEHSNTTRLINEKKITKEV